MVEQYLHYIVQKKKKNTKNHNINFVENCILFIFMCDFLGESLVFGYQLAYRTPSEILKKLGG